MGSRILLTFTLEVEVSDPEELVYAGIAADEARGALGRPAERTAEFHEDMRNQPSLALGCLLEPETILGHVPGVRVTGSQHSARDLADDERLFPRPGERRAGFPPT